MYEEIRRDLKEMGIRVKTFSMQNKAISFDQDFETTELQNYSYMLLNANSMEISTHLPVDKEWSDEEFRERVAPVAGNPGKAWSLRGDTWRPFLNEGGMFDYTYGERFTWHRNLENIINTLHEDPYSRRLWLGVWFPETDSENIGRLVRVPCSIGYQFQYRNNKLHMHYIMRSCDFSEHYANDVYLATRLLEYVASCNDIETGNFTHTIFSLHVYNKDIKEVF
jgi:thymidylate synthase